MILAGLLALLVMAGDASPRTRTLFSIGVADGSDHDLRPVRPVSGEFPADADYLVGVSSPAEDWPALQPGPDDDWGGRKAHLFSIAFFLEAPVAKGRCSLLIDLIDTGFDTSGSPEVTVNGTMLAAVPAGEDSGGAGRRMRVDVSASLLKEGKNEIWLVTTRGRWLRYDAVALLTPRGMRLLREPTIERNRIGEPHGRPAVIARGDERLQPVRVEVRHWGPDERVRLRVDEGPGEEVVLHAGVQWLDFLVRAVTKESAVRLGIESAASGERLAQWDFTVRPVRPMTVHLLHQTHLDLGYAHLVPEVKKLQREHLDTALRLAEERGSYPEGARFAWLPEALWAVDAYLGAAGPAGRQRFGDAVREGSIGLDALYGNMLTGLCRPEELFEMTAYARRLGRELGMTIESAMLSDVPGCSWGVVPALAGSGVRYLSISQNPGHRVGNAYALADRPFYWLSPSGEEKLLTWVSGKDYSWYFAAPLRDEGKLFGYLDELEAKGFPYDEVPVRYGVCCDNGPPDPGLPDFVRGWNEKYLTPKLVIGTTGEFFRGFERRHGSELPEMRGDFTPYWEDGAGSSARETAVNRASAERLVQAEAIWAMKNPSPFPEREFQDAWREILLYDEHTWGAHNSVSKPDAPFVAAQWEAKRNHALEGERRSKRLAAAAGGGESDGRVDFVQVYNTQTWPRTGLVTLPASWKTPGDRVTGAEGVVPSQRLTTGELAFFATGVPPLGSAIYRIEKGEPGRPAEAAVVNGLRLANGLVEATLSRESGAIADLRSEFSRGNLVETGSGMGVNEYLYVEGRDPATTKRNGRPTIRVKERGPLVCSLLAESAAPGCDRLLREVRLVAGVGQVELIDTLRKKRVDAKESVHIAFPFAIEGAEARLDLGLAVIRPDVDQLAGSNRNFFPVQRWVDLANASVGVTVATPDAPLVELGGIAVDAKVTGWLEKTPGPRNRLFSYVMNNYWETNYRAWQDGPTTFRYALLPHGPFDYAQAQRFGLETSQPLAVFPVGSDATPSGALFSLDESGVTASRVKPADGGLFVRLFNGTDAAKEVTLVGEGGSPLTIRRSDANEGALGGFLPGRVTMMPWQVLPLRVDLPAGGSEPR